MSVITCRNNQLRGAGGLEGKRPTESLYNYVGGSTGGWEITSLTARRGDSLAAATHLEIYNGRLKQLPAGTSWILSGQVRNTRYVTREEFLSAGSRRYSDQPPAPTCAALIPIRRSALWWQMDQATRRELQSPHRPVGMQYLSSMIQRWQHRRDLSGQFDCVTWFEYEPRDAAAFDDLLADWRASEAWKHVERECDLRLVRVA